MRRLLAATDDSPQGDHAFCIGKQLAVLSGAELAVVRVREPAARPDPERPAVPCLIDAAAQTFRRDGVAGVEITRCAEQWNADLLLLGRRNPTGIGRTTDMVLRRRHGPTLVVPRRVTRLARVLYALDGSERGLRILEGDRNFPAVSGASAMSLCVLPPEPAHAGLGPAWHHPRRTRVEAAMERRPDLGGLAALTIRWGDPVREVLDHLVANAADLLVLGLR
ncbi:MAG TPA: universal stress protein, partial [Gemmatimonadales bacterium]|nr:universal stress protein [Gemmatimonadales bacterium]